MSYPCAALAAKRYLSNRNLYYPSTAFDPKCQTGGKPSTWFPPGVEQSIDEEQNDEDEDKNEDEDEDKNRE